MVACDVVVMTNWAFLAFRRITRHMVVVVITRNLCALCARCHFTWFVCKYIGVKS